jgi:hypothetical protein
MQLFRLGILVGLLSAGACDGKTRAASAAGVAGDYSAEGTSVVNSLRAPGPPAGIDAPKAYDPKLSVTDLGNSEFRINVTSGLSFTAQLRDGILRAHDAPVTIDPKGSAAAYYWTSDTLTDFRWNLATGSYQFTDGPVIDVPGGGLSRGFADARIVGLSDASRRSVHYHVDTNFPWDFPHGADCMLGGAATADGYLELAHGGTPSELGIYVQGVGCTITAKTTDDNVFTANGVDCPLDPVMSIKALGIQSWTFETFSLDVASKHVSFLARATRQRDNGDLVDLCLMVDSDLTGEFPSR